MVQMKTWDLDFLTEPRYTGQREAYRQWSLSSDISTEEFKSLKFKVKKS